MAKLVRMLAPDNGMDFDDICAFKTEELIGLYDYEQDEFVLICSESDELHIFSLDRCKSLQELYEQVLNRFGEHITDVFGRSKYRIVLEEADDGR